MGQTQNSGDGVKAANGIFFSPGEAVQSLFCHDILMTRTLQENVLLGFTILLFKVLKRHHFV